MIDKKKIEQAVVLFLEGIGEDPSRAGLVETPDRIARMCQELFCGLEQTAAEPLAKRFERGSAAVCSRPPNSS